MIRNLHLADEDVLDAVENLANSDAPVRLLVVVTARSTLLSRRPTWGGGKPDAASITVESRGSGTVDRLRRLMVSVTDGGSVNGVSAVRRAWNLSDEWPLMELKTHQILAEAQPT